MSKLNTNKTIRNISLFSRIKRAVKAFKSTLAQKRQEEFMSPFTQGLTMVIGRVAKDPAEWSDVSVVINQIDVVDDNGTVLGRHFTADGSVYFEVLLTEEEMVELHRG